MIQTIHTRKKEMLKIIFFFMYERLITCTFFFVTTRCVSCLVNKIEIFSMHEYSHYLIMLLIFASAEFFKNNKPFSFQKSALCILFTRFLCSVAAVVFAFRCRWKINTNEKNNVKWERKGLLSLRQASLYYLFSRYHLEWVLLTCFLFMSDIDTIHSEDFSQSAENTKHVWPSPFWMKLLTLV